ncbi:MAG TPA: HIT family protein [Burkholderiales bacterium]|nr:HIT family protein [Burkholderiales bacterium]
MSCELCASDGGKVLWRDDFCRVVRIASEEFPGFCRVILARHVREMTDLAPPERERLMRAVLACEQALREVLAPHKVNLASLGNQVAHLHWHVIPRFEDDSRFPDPAWAPARRAGAQRAAPADAVLAARLSDLLGPA